MRKILLLATAAAVGLAGCAMRPSSRAQLVREPQRCMDQTAQIYFAPDQAELTPDGQRVLTEAAAETRACRVTAVEVIGLADAAGAAGANLELSKRRARSVAAWLAANGLPPAEFKVEAAGQAGARTSDGRAAPLRRRADVILHLAPA